MPTKTDAKPAARKSRAKPVVDAAPLTAPAESAVIEPEVLPEPIVTWQPTHSVDHAAPMRSSTAVGFFILGAVAVAAVAITAVAIDRATRD
jgi:hypothetical protein